MGLIAWCRELRDILSPASHGSTSDRDHSRLADTSDDGMIETLARAVILPSASRWERAAIRATIGLHATRSRDAGSSSEQGLERFKELLERALPPVSVRSTEQSRTAKDMVRWWVEAYYEPDV
jgi:hypothetical protein